MVRLLDEFKSNEVVSIKFMKRQPNEEDLETSGQWAWMTGLIIDKFIGKTMSMTYDFR